MLLADIEVWCAVLIEKPVAHTGAPVMYDGRDGPETKKNNVERIFLLLMDYLKKLQLQLENV